jgi:hypothetical protein
VLGRFPDAPRLRREAVMASDFGELDRAVNALETTLHDAWENDRPLREVEIVRPISFYLAVSGTPEWGPITDKPGAFSLSSYEGPFVSASLSPD